MQPKRWVTAPRSASPRRPCRLLQRPLGCVHNRRGLGTSSGGRRVAGRGQPALTGSRLNLAANGGLVFHQRVNLGGGEEEGPGGLAGPRARIAWLAVEERKLAQHVSGTCLGDRLAVAAPLDPPLDDDEALSAGGAL